MHISNEVETYKYAIATASIKYAVLWMLRKILQIETKQMIEADIREE